MSGVLIFDDVLPNPFQYRADALTSEFRTYDFPPVFHGIAIAPQGPIRGWLQKFFPELKIKTTFFRRAPKDQAEPNYIHSDEMMGDWTGVLYLNPEPPPGDGTIFWRHRTTLKESGSEWMYDGHQTEKWIETQRVTARFNRLLLFRANYFHSRAMPENYGEFESARLVQVIFGAGEWA